MITVSDKLIQKDAAHKLGIYAISQQLLDFLLTIIQEPLFRAGSAFCEALLC
jgi:hypothetical protein